MQAVITYGMPKPGFWEAYQELWRESLYHPAFQAPHYLKALAEANEGKVITYQSSQDGQLVGAALFKQEGKRCRFLSDLLSGQNFFVLRQGLGEASIKAFLALLLQSAKREKWAMVLNMQPAWASYMPAFREACRHSGLFWATVPFAACPVLEMEDGAAVAQHLGRSAHLRKKMNQLLRRHEVTFEVLSGDEDLDAWLESYFRWHVFRWKDSPTPSNYSNPQARALFAACLRGWIEDGLAVRFALRTSKGERITLCIGLRQENTLVDYYEVYNHEYARYTPSKGILLFIGEWMKTQGLNTLDMGYGDYQYKYEFTNKDLQLHRFYLSSYFNLPLVFKAKVEKAYRERPRLMAFYRKIKHFIKRDV